MRMSKSHKNLISLINEALSNQTKNFESKFSALEDNRKELDTSKSDADSVTFNPDYNDSQINKFVELNRKVPLLYIKYGLILSFCIFLILNFIIAKEKNFNILNIQLSFNYNKMQFDYIFIILVIAAWALNLVIALNSHVYIYCQSTKNTKKQKIHLTLQPKQRRVLVIFSREERMFKCLNKIIDYLDNISRIFLKNFLKPSFLILISPDLFFANFYKNNLKSQNLETEHFSISSPAVIDNKGLTISHWNTIKILFQNFIIKSNWLNVCISIIITISIVFLTPKYIESIEVMQFLFIFVFFRLISRGLEIAIAFYKDVVKVDSKLFLKVQLKQVKDTYLIDQIQSTRYINGYKSSLLREGTRLSLAIHSLLELFITFALAFYLLFNILALLDESYFTPSSNSSSVKVESEYINKYINEETPISLKSTEDVSISAPTYVETFLFSASLGLFNISYVTYQNILISILHFYQVLLSVILIFLSIARYLNNDKTLTPQDERLYEITALKNYESTKYIEEYLKDKLNYGKNNDN